MSEIPETIFKYEGISVQSLQNLKDQRVYFGSPRNFNDPYDCTITATVEELTEEEAVDFRKRILADPNCTHEAFVEASALSPVELQQSMSRVVRGGVQKAIQDFLSTCGVTCFSERSDSLLMWSHYGGKHGGFCLEFRTTYEPFNKLHKVEYTDDMPVVSAREILLDLQFERLKSLYCTKSSCWEYEREWRAIHKVGGTPYGYAAEALKAIYFGPRMDRSTKEIICLILQGQNSQVELWEGRHVPDRFEIKFDRVDYTSFVDVERKRGQE